MAWSISMSAQGWSNVWANLHLCMSKDELINALVDDDFQALEQAEETPEDAAAWFDQRKAFYAPLPHETLADACFERVEEHNTCDNGGWAVWIDREGFHTVPVDYQGEDADENGDYTGEVC